MLDPGLGNAVVSMGKRKAIGAWQLIKTGRVKIRTGLIGFRSFNAVFDVLWFDLVT